MEPEITLDDAIDALRNKDKSRARELLDAVIRQDPQNDTAWMYMALASDNRKQALACLERATQINPANNKAWELIEKLESQSTGQSQRKATARKGKSNPLKFALIGVGSLLVIVILLIGGLLISGYFNKGPSVAAIPPSTTVSKAALSPQASVTPTPVASTPTRDVPPTWTPRPIPRTDIEVCKAELNDSYLNAYVQWTGEIMGTPRTKDGAQWFQVLSPPPSSDSECRYEDFFVSYHGSERFYKADFVIVTGTIIDTKYEYTGALEQREYSVIVRADNIQVVSELTEPVVIFPPTPKLTPTPEPMRVSFPTNEYQTEYFSISVLGPAIRMEAIIGGEHTQTEARGVYLIVPIRWHNTSLIERYNFIHGPKLCIPIPSSILECETVGGMDIFATSAYYKLKGLKQEQKLQPGEFTDGWMVFDIPEDMVSPTLRIPSKDGVIELYLE